MESDKNILYSQVKQIKENISLFVCLFVLSNRVTKILYVMFVRDIRFVTITIRFAFIFCKTEPTIYFQSDSSVCKFCIPGVARKA